MEGIKKQPKAMFYVPGIIAICIGMAVLGIETPDRTIRFGADFYTETYQAIAEVSHVIKTVAAYVLFALGALSLGKGMVEAKRSDLMLEELGAIRMALEESKAHTAAGSAAEVTPDASRTLDDTPDAATPVELQDDVPVAASVVDAEDQQGTPVGESSDQDNVGLDEGQKSE